MTEQTETPKHPDPDRHWNRKFILACACVGFAGAIYIIGLFGGYSESLIMSGVWAFLLPMLLYFGVAEVNNTVKQIWK